MRLPRRTGLAAGVVLLVCAAPACAAPVSVDLRIEGAGTTLFEGPVTTDARAVDGNDGSGAHACDAGARAPTAGTALADAAARAPFAWRANWNAGFGDFLVATLAGETPDFAATQTFWGFYLNGQFASTGVCGARLSGGEKVLFAVADGSEQLLALSGPATARPGEAIAVSVTDAGSARRSPGPRSAARRPTRRGRRASRSPSAARSS